MKLMIDGYSIEARTGESLLDLLKRTGMLRGRLSSDPIAAKIAGEVFTLNYIPVRQKDVEQERPSMRRAMAASGGVVRLLRYTDPTGRDVYTRTAQFVLFLAIHRLWPGARVKMSCNVGAGLYFKVRDAETFSVEALRREVKSLVEADITIRRHRMPTEQAVQYYRERGMEDKARLLSYRSLPYVDLYRHEDFLDYYYGETAPSTGFLRVWEIMEAPGGFVLIYPDARDPDRVASNPELPNLLSVYNDGKQWCELMRCETLADLNELVDSGEIRTLVRVNEALHEKRFSAVADMVSERGCRAVLLAGPSSSGKTTSANRLATQLRVHGKRPVLMSLDDYYLDRDQIQPGEDGKPDLEHINTLDVSLFRAHLRDLLRGECVELPTFNFKTGKREWRGEKLRLESDSVVIIEGLHALNPILMPTDVEEGMIFRLYVSPLLPLNMDDHNRIAASYLRLLRRIVRDHEFRGAPVQQTMSMWDSVRRGEARWIFPFQESADVIFNSSTLYELAVLKKHIFPLLTAIGPEEDCYDEVRAIVKVLNFVHEADIDDEIPPTSLVREFIGGNTFYR